MAILKDLIVSGSSRLLGKLYTNDIEISGTAVFASLSTTGNATIGGTLGVTGATTQTGKFTVNNVIEQHGDGIELYYSTPHIDFHYGSNTADYTSRIIESAQGVITITPKLSTSTANITTANITTANTNKINNADMITTSALDVKGKLHAVEYDLENIMDLGGSFVVAPTLIVPSSGSGTKSLTVTKSNNTTVVMTVRDPSITSGGIAGFAWANNYKVKVSGLVNNTVLGTCDGYINTTNVGSNTISLTVTMDAATVTAIATTVSNYKLNIMLYNTDTSSATAVTKPLGIYLQHYQLTNNPIINVWNGQTTTPKVRIGYLGGITYNGSALGTNAQNSWGLYSDSVFLEGQIIAKGGTIAGWTIGDGYITTNSNRTTYDNTSYTGMTMTASGIGARGSATSYFNLSTSGGLTAIGADVTGVIKANTGYIGGSSGWTIAAQQLYSGTIGADNSLHLGTKNLGSNTSIGGRSGSDWRMTVGQHFGVTNTGALYCNDIHATGGTISGSLVSSGISANNITTGTLSADRIDAGAIAIGKLDTSTQTKINNGDAAKTALNNYGYLYKKDIIIYGESNKYYPVYFVGGEQNVARETLISRGYNEQAPSDWNTSTHKGGLTFRVKWNFGGWGGATYKAAILDFSEMYSTMVAQVRAGYDSGLTGVVWLRGGGTTGAIYHIYSDQPVEAERYGCNAPYIGLTQDTVFMQSGSTQWKVAAPLTAPNTVELKTLYTDEYANSFITYVNATDGIKIHNASDTTNYLQMNSNAIKFFKNGTQKMYLDNSNLQFTNGSTVLAQFGTSGATIGQTTGTYGNVLIEGGTTNASIKIRQGSTVLSSFTSSGTTIGADTSGVTRTVITSSGIDFIRKDGSTDVNLAHIGYDVGNAGSGTSTKPFYTFGFRQSGFSVGNYSMAEGHEIVASGYCSHAEGYLNVASGVYAHAEGHVCHATAVGTHAEGGFTHATGMYSHSQGYGTKASSDYQTVIGRLNVEDDENKYAFIIGNGFQSEEDYSDTYSNALTVDWKGNVEPAMGYAILGASNKTITSTTNVVVTGVGTKAKKGDMFAIVDDSVNILRSGYYRIFCSWIGADSLTNTTNVKAFGVCINNDTANTIAIAHGRSKSWDVYSQEDIVHLNANCYVSLCGRNEAGAGAFNYIRAIITPVWMD